MQPLLTTLIYDLTWGVDEVTALFTAFWWGLSGCCFLIVRFF
jgi:hypothetical protein